MKTTRLLAFILLLTVVCFGMDQKTLIVSKVFDQPTPDTREMTITRDGSSETLYVDRTVIISEKDIGDASVFIDRGSIGILVTLNEVGKAKFAELTKESLDKRLAFIIDGQLVSAPGIKGVIKGGSFPISGNMTKEFAEKVVKAWKHNEKG